MFIPILLTLRLPISASNSSLLSGETHTQYLVTTIIIIINKNEITRISFNKNNPDNLSAKTTFLLLLAQPCVILLRLYCLPWAMKIVVLPLPIKINKQDNRLILTSSNYLASKLLKIAKVHTRRLTLLTAVTSLGCSILWSDCYVTHYYNHFKKGWM